MKQVTLGWDGLPTIVNEDGTIYPRKAELIFHAKYYPDYEKEKWPIDPETGEKLPIESRNNKILFRHSRRNDRRSGKVLAKRLRLMVQDIFWKKPVGPVMAGGPIAELIYLKFFNKNDRH
jgi:hypothetical protein